MPNPFPCNSIGNAQCAMANEIQRYRPNLMPLALKSRAKLTWPPPRPEKKRPPTLGQIQAQLTRMEDLQRLSVE
jgi:hypothetical protein